jgi:hypothetical protein
MKLVGPCSEEAKGACFVMPSGSLLKMELADFVRVVMNLLLLIRRWGHSLNPICPATKQNKERSPALKC